MYLRWLFFTRFQCCPFFRLFIWMSLPLAWAITGITSVTQIKSLGKEKISWQTQHALDLPFFFCDCLSSWNSDSSAFLFCSYRFDLFSSMSFLNRPRELFMAVTFTETAGLFNFNDVSLFASANISAHAVLVAVPDCDAGFKIERNVSRSFLLVPSR